MIKNIEKEVESITKWIKEYVEKSTAKGVVIGNSGGKDSATVIALAAKALGNKKVVTVAMPCNSIQTDIEDAKLVANTFNVEMIEVDLSKTYEVLENEINKSIAIKNNETKVNIKPRLRMTTLYAIAQELGYLVIGTGNKCEATVGYTTKWGDNACDFNPIGEFTVEEVLQIAKFLNVPEKIVNKAPNDGLGGLTDEQKLGVTYAQVSEYIETGTTDKNALEIIKKKEKASEHKRRVITIYKRLN